MVNMLKHNKNYFFKSPIYIKEHTDILESIEKELGHIGKYNEQLEVIEKYFTVKDPFKS